MITHKSGTANRRRRIQRRRGAAAAATAAADAADAGRQLAVASHRDDVFELAGCISIVSRIVALQSPALDLQTAAIALSHRKIPL